MLWNQQVETLPRTDMAVWQSHKLRKVMERIYDKSILYKSRMDEYKLLPENITGIEDLKKFPFTTREDIAVNYPYGLLTMPVSGVAYIHTMQEAASGRIAVSYTKNDMAMWTELMSRIFVAGGMNVTSIFQWLGSPAEYTASLGVHRGVEQIGATLLPDSTSEIAEQIHFIEDFGVTSIFADPSYLLKAAKEAEMQGREPKRLPLQNIFCDSKCLSPQQSETIEQVYGTRPVEMYGIYDIWGMGAAGECHCRNGLHIQEDCFYPELVHPVNGQVLPMGETGELVLTSLTLEAMPLLRFRTGIQCRLDDRTCACGRTLIRMKKETGEGLI